MRIADYIAEDLRGCLESSAELPFRLTLESMSRHYGVSVTPVRTAVDRLLAEGLLRRTASRRLATGSGGRRRRAATAAEGGAARLPPAPGALRRRVVDLVVRASLQGESRYLRETATAQALGVGRSVAQRIFHQLAGAGMLEHVPRCGWRVHALREEDVRAFLEVRETLEIEAIDLARGKLDRQALEQLRRGNEPAADGTARLDNRLHAYWIERCGNRYIQEFFRTHGEYYLALFDYATFADEAVVAMADQHREILDALIAGRRGGAKRVLRQHIRAQGPTLARVIASSGRQRTAQVERRP